MPRLEEYLVLNRYFHSLLGADQFEALKALLRPMPEGPDGSGQSHFLMRLATQPGLQIARDDLERYDRRVMDYEADLRRARRGFQGWRYFQYLALLYSEIVLDRLTADPVTFTAELNRFLAGLRARESELAEFPAFEPGALRRLAFFMATGSGKTLLMHVHIRQVLHYLQHGRHPEALLPGRPHDRQFDNILLITPNEGSRPSTSPSCAPAAWARWPLSRTPTPTAAPSGRWSRSSRSTSWPRSPRAMA